MFKQVFRVAFVTLIWKQYKAAILSTLLLVVYLLLVKNIHADILLAKTQSGASANIGISIALKWLAYAVGVVCYLCFHIFRGLKPKPQTLKDKAKEANIAANDDNDDPFASIRERKVLRSRADFLDGKD
jgi:hypothetical protein